jgi:hypothetical protein
MLGARSDIGFVDDRRGSDSVVSSPSAAQTLRRNPAVSNRCLGRRDTVCEMLAVTAATASSCSSTGVCGRPHAFAICEQSLARWVLGTTPNSRSDERLIRLQELGCNHDARTHRSTHLVRSGVKESVAPCVAPIGACTSGSGLGTPKGRHYQQGAAGVLLADQALSRTSRVRVASKDCSCLRCATTNPAR